MVKLYGYTVESANDESVVSPDKMSEVAIEVSSEAEVDELIAFLVYARERIFRRRVLEDCHFHFKDWLAVERRKNVEGDVIVGLSNPLKPPVKLKDVPE